MVEAGNTLTEAPGVGDTGETGDPATFEGTVVDEGADPATLEGQVLPGTVQAAAQGDTQDLRAAGGGEPASPVLLKGGVSMNVAKQPAPATPVKATANPPAKAPAAQPARTTAGTAPAAATAHATTAHAAPAAAKPGIQVTSIFSSPEKTQAAMNSMVSSAVGTVAGGGLGSILSRGGAAPTSLAAAASQHAAHGGIGHVTGDLAGHATMGTHTGAALEQAQHGHVDPAQVFAETGGALIGGGLGLFGGPITAFAGGAAGGYMASQAYQLWKKNQRPAGAAHAGSPAHH